MIGRPCSIYSTCLERRATRARTTRPEQEQEQEQEQPQQQHTITPKKHMGIRVRAKSRKTFFLHRIYFSNNLIIIGDKILTDGLFARHIGATFIKVERYKSKKDRLITKIIYRLDDLCQYLLS